MCCCALLLLPRWAKPTEGCGHAWSHTLTAKKHVQQRCSRLQAGAARRTTVQLSDRRNGEATAAAVWCRVSGRACSSALPMTATSAEAPACALGSESLTEGVWNPPSFGKSQQGRRRRLGVSHDIAESRFERARQTRWTRDGDQRTCWNGHLGRRAGGLGSVTRWWWWWWVERQLGVDLVCQLGVGVERARGRTCLIDLGAMDLGQLLGQPLFARRDSRMVRMAGRGSWRTGGT